MTLICGWVAPCGAKLGEAIVFADIVEAKIRV
jgi:hypothetical protein